MGRTKNFFCNSMFTALMQFIVLIVGFITPRVFLKAYGSEINGLVSSLTQFISYFNLVEAGLSGASVYALYKPLAERDCAAINAVVTASKNFYTKSGYIFSALVVGLAILYPLYVTANTLDYWGIFALVIIISTSGVLEFFTLAKYRALLTADQKTYVISIASSIYHICNTVIIVILANLGTNIVLLRFIALSAIFLRTVILAVYCKRHYRFLDFSVTPNNDALNKRWDALVLQILGVIHTGAPIVLITLIVKDLKIVSVYAIFNMVMGGISSVLGIFNSGLAASFGDVIAQGEREILKKAYSEFELAFYMLITVVYAVSFVMITSFVNLYTNQITDTNYNLPILGFLFVLNGLLYHLKTPQGMLVISAGLYKETKIQASIQAMIEVLLGALLAVPLGIYGVLLGSIASNLYRDIDLMIFIPKYVTRTRISTTAMRMLRVCIYSVAVIFLMNFVNHIPESYLNWTLMAAILSSFSFVTVIGLNLVFERENVLGLIDRVKNMFVQK